MRLITPPRMGYEDSYAKAFPLDKLVEGVLTPQMTEDTVQLVREAIRHHQ